MGKGWILMLDKPCAPVPPGMADSSKNKIRFYRFEPTCRRWRAGTGKRPGTLENLTIMRCLVAAKALLAAQNSPALHTVHSRKYVSMGSEGLGRGREGGLPPYNGGQAGRGCGAQAIRGGGGMGYGFAFRSRAAASRLNEPPTGGARGGRVCNSLRK